LRDATQKHTGDQAVYAPNSAGGPFADLTSPVEESWESEGPMVRSASALHAEDDDFGQAGTLVRDIWNDAQRAEFVDTVAGHLPGGVTGEVLHKAFECWKSVDPDTGKQIEEKVRGAGAV
jgi:catalase